MKTPELCPASVGWTRDVYLVGEETMEDQRGNNKLCYALHAALQCHWSV